jgi:hypothetical protein
VKACHAQRQGNLPNLSVATPWNEKSNYIGDAQIQSVICRFHTSVFLPSKCINIPTNTLHATRLGGGPLKRQRAGEFVRMTLSLKNLCWWILASNSMKCQLMDYLRSKILPIQVYRLRHFITPCIRSSRFPLTRSFPFEHYSDNQKITNAIVETRYSLK